MKSITVAGISCLLLANCASIVSKSDYPVSITSNPPGCKVIVRKSDGAVMHQGTTPTSVVLPSGAGYFKPASYDLEFSGKGISPQTVNVKADMNGWYAGNILFGGLIGLLIVDPLTGAMWRMEPTVNADLAPLAVLDAGGGRKLQVVDRSALPSHLETNLIALR